MEVKTASATGWILASDVASFLKPDDLPRIRRTLNERATRLLGFIYFWGGRSAFSMTMFTGGKQLTGLGVQLIRFSFSFFSSSHA
jgi:hypothetical protein